MLSGATNFTGIIKIAIILIKKKNFWHLDISQNNLKLSISASLFYFLM